MRARADTGTIRPAGQVGRHLWRGLRGALPPRAAERRRATPPCAGRGGEWRGWLCTRGCGALPDEVLSWSVTRNLRHRPQQVGRTLRRSSRPCSGRALALAATPSRPGATVAIRGFALTFIDAALALTEGRGGSFEPLDHPYRLRLRARRGRRRRDPPVHAQRPADARQARPAIARAHPWARAHRGRGPGRIADVAGTVDLHGDLVSILPRQLREPGRGRRRRDRRLWASPPAGGSPRPPAGPTPRGSRRRWRPSSSRWRSAPTAAPGLPWALGHTWRALYPALVSRLGGDGLAERDWPAFLRLAAEMERVAFGPPPLNAAKLLALIEAGRVDLGTCTARGSERQTAARCCASASERAPSTP